MEIQDYVIEAALQLRAPVELRLFRDHFAYDPASREWCFQGAGAKGPGTLAEAREWMERICGWLQYRYPEGPPDELN